MASPAAATPATAERLRFAAILAASWAGHDPADLAQEMADQLDALLDVHAPDLPPAPRAVFGSVLKNLAPLPGLVRADIAAGADCRGIAAIRAAALAEVTATATRAHFEALGPALCLELAGLAHALAQLPDLIADHTPLRGRPQGLPPAEEA